MALILFVAELGGGFGHVKRLLPVARAAARVGHRPLFLVPNPAEAAMVVAGDGLEVRVTPSAHFESHAPRPRGAVATSYADVLGGVGFGDPGLLLAAVRAWDEVLAALSPLAVVAEMSPFLNLATFGSSLRVLGLGHGFGLPPPHLPRFPTLVPGQASFDEAALLESAQLVCQRRAREEPSTLPSLLGATVHEITGFDVLDPYRAARLRPSVGPPELEARPGTTEPSDDVFVYLLGSAATTLRVLTGLAKAGLSGRVFVRNAQAEQRATVERSRLTWLSAPEPIAQALDRSRSVIHHGSMLMAEEALAAGKPQVVVPLYLEHLLTARALRDLGVATVVRPGLREQEILALLASIASDASLRLAARRFSENLWRTSPPPRDLAETLLRLVVDA